MYLLLVIIFPYYILKNSIPFHYYICAETRGEMPRRRPLPKKGKIEIIFDKFSNIFYNVLQRPITFNLVILAASLSLFIFTTNVQEKGINRYYLHEIKYWNDYEKKPFGLTLVDVPIYADNMGSVKWLSKDYTNEFNKNISNCPLCSFTRDNPKSNSSPKDLLLAIMLKRIFHSLTYIRSFRTTGCKATCVVFIDDPAYTSFTDFMIEKFDQCGVIFINLGDVEKLYRNSITESRFVLFYAFLRKYYKEFDRVMSTDMSDTFFQTDPFTTDVENPNQIYFSTECVSISDSGPNKEWVEGADPQFDSDFYSDKLVVNNGFFLGKMVAVLKFLSVYIDVPQFYDFYVTINDQGLLNYNIYRGKFLKAGLVANYTQDHEVYKSVTRCRFKEIHSHEEGIYLENSENLLSVIHQFDRFCALMNVVKLRCPSLGDDHLEPFGEIRHTLDTNCMDTDLAFRYDFYYNDTGIYGDDDWWLRNPNGGRWNDFDQNDENINDEDKLQKQDIEDDKKFEY